MKKRIFSAVLVLLVSISLISPVNIFAEDEIDNVNDATLVESMNVDISSKKVTVGSSYSLKTTLIKGEDSYIATVDDVEYKISNSNVATVSQSGVVTAKTPGSADITITTKDGSNISVVSKVVVIPCKVSGVKLKEGINKVKITYKKTKGAKVYYIYRSTKKSSGYKLIGKTTKLSYIDKKLTNKKAKYYYYKVKALYGAYKGYASNAARIKVRHFIKMRVTCTAYCGCSRCCGKSNCITASGKKARAYRTIAAWRGLKFGTKVYFPKMKKYKNKGMYVVEDRGGAISSKRIDIYFSSHRKALQFGRRKLTAYIVR